MARHYTPIHVAALLLCCGSAFAQTPPATHSLPAVRVQSATVQPDVSGWGDVPSRETPLSVQVFDAQALADIGARRVSDAARLDASVADSYNSPAYWDLFSIRGFTLDNRYNYRRDGLPISAETMIPLDNIDRLEILKGTSGIQAGTSSPGGLVNYVVKRPPAAGQAPIRSVTVEASGRATLLLAADLGGRFGADQAFGYRINLASEKLEPYTEHSEGHRHSASMAMDWRINRDTLLEWEISRSHRGQYGVNAYSILGSTLPAPVDPRRNLTYQSWSVPGQFDATTGSIRLQQALGQSWSWKLHYGAQRLRTDDRLAFGYGCSAEGNYDRFCSDGSFDLYDYRSNNERRLSDALLAELAGQARWGAFTHDLQFALLRQRQLDRMPPLQAYNYAGWGSVNGSGSSVPDPTPSYSNTNRSEYATELGIKDRIRWGSGTSVWLGLRHTRYDRSSQQNDPPGSNAVTNRGHINTPWAAVSTQAQGVNWYASHGHGVEVFVAPNSPSYINAGQQLGVGRSRQTELGARSSDNGPWQWQVALFHIERPLAYDFAGWRVVDGQQVHRGLEAGVQWKQGVWSAGASAQWLRARLVGTTIDPALSGQRPINVPQHTLRAFVEQRLTSLPGVRWTMRVSHEGPRSVTQDGDIQLPAWTTLDASLYWDMALGANTRTTWSVGIDNLADKRYWRESPRMFGHHYLYPGAPRTWRLGATTTF